MVAEKHIEINKLPQSAIFSEFYTKHTVNIVVYLRVCIV